VDALVRVLVADDDEDIRLLVCLALRRAGCTVVAAVETGAQALVAARAQRPDVVVLDVAMPGVTGLEVCEALRADPDPELAGCRVLLLSAGASSDDVARGLAAGADAYLPKPFTIAGLIAEVRELTARPRV
jgi:CheY-like chemotaxis protein